MVISSRMPQTHAVIDVSRALSRDSRLLQNSAIHDVTPHLGHELATVGSGADHIRLDSGFLDRSKKFAELYNPHALVSHANGAIDSMRGVHGEVLNAADETLSVHMKALDSVSVDKRQQVSLARLQQARYEMQPHIKSSVRRIEHFCDHTGVTDRYIGYRHNLNRGNKAADAGYVIGKPKNLTLTSVEMGETCMPSVEAFNERQRAISSAPVQSNRQPIDQRPPLPARSIQERCGINMTYPGISEYKKRYSFNHKTQYYDYALNPSPDFGRIGRPFSTYVPLRNDTEYNTRYGIPDGDSVHRFPWLRQ